MINFRYWLTYCDLHILKLCTYHFSKMYACSQNCHTIQVLGISVMNWNILTTLMVLTIKHSSDHCQAKIYIGHPTLLPLAFCPPWNACVKIIVRYCQNSRRQNNPSRNISGNAICIPVLQRYANRKHTLKDLSLIAYISAFKNYG